MFRWEGIASVKAGKIRGERTANTSGLRPEKTGNQMYIENTS